MELEILTEILLKPEERAWNGLRNKDLRKTWGDNQAAGIRVRQRVVGYLVIIKSLFCHSKLSFHEAALSLVQNLTRSKAAMPRII
jgi:hypothetical protein